MNSERIYELLKVCLVDFTFNKGENYGRKKNV